MAKLMERDATGRTTLLTGVRASFAETLRVAKAPKNSAPGTRETHGANLILERGSKDFDKNVEILQKALAAAAREGKRKEEWWQDLFQNDPKQLSFRKGERFKDKDGNVYKGYEDNLIVIAKGPKGGMSRPRVMDRHKRDVEVNDINDVVYNGTYCDAVVSWYYTDNGGTPRLTCSVEAIRSHQEGERLGGGGIYVDADDFDDMEGDDDGFDTTSQQSSSGSSSGLIL